MASANQQLSPVEPIQILCYGDSNTWGLEALTFRRFGASVRWTGVAQRALGPEYKVLEEGLSGRTTVRDDPLCNWLPPNTACDPAVCNGIKSLLPILHSAKPVAVVVLALGCNDLKTRFHATPSEIAAGVGMLANTIQQSEAGPAAVAGENVEINPSPPKILIVCPPPCTNEEFFPDLKGAIEKSKALPKCYQEVAHNNASLHCEFLDAGSVKGVVCDDADGIHMTKEAHEIFGLAIAQKLKEMLLVK